MSANLFHTVSRSALELARDLSTFSHALFSPLSKPLVGHSALVSERKRGRAARDLLVHKTNLGRRRERRWTTAVQDWIDSDLPPPNSSLVIHLCRGETIGEMSAGQELTKHLDEVRRRIVRFGAPWLAAWVIELRHGIHAHVMLYLPEDLEFRQKFARWLMKRFGMPVVPGQSPLFVLQKCNTGQPVHLGVISQTRRYRTTGRFGAEGMMDYCAKSIIPDCRKTSRGWKLGRQVGYSTDLTDLLWMPTDES